MPTTWEELVATVTARYPLRCRQSRHLRVLAGSVLSGAEPFDPGMGRPMREWVLVPAARSDEWERLVTQAIG